MINWKISNLLCSTGDQEKMQQHLGETWVNRAIERKNEKYKFPGLIPGLRIL